MPHNHKLSILQKTHYKKKIVYIVSAGQWACMLINVLASMSDMQLIHIAQLKLHLLSIQLSVVFFFCYD